MAKAVMSTKRRIDTKNAWITCSKEGCPNLKDGHCCLDGIYIDP